MTLMKLVNSARKFRHEWTSFTNLIQVWAVPEAWTRLYIHIYNICIYIYIIYPPVNLSSLIKAWGCSMEDLGDLKLSHWGDFPLLPFITRGYILKDHLVVNGGKVLELGWARGIHVPVLKWGAQELVRVSQPHDSFYTVYPYTHTCITCVYLPFSLSL